jgi:hypothetical protein
MAANLSETHRERIRGRGFLPIPVEEGFATLDRLVVQGMPQVVAVPADWDEYAKRVFRGVCPSLLANLISSRAGTETSEPKTNLQTIWAALPAGQRLARMRELVEEKAAHALGFPPGKPPDRQRSLHEQGLDSLMSVELRNALATSLGHPLSATLLFDYPTVLALAHHLVKDVLKLDLAESASPMAESKQEPDKEIEELESMSESEAESLLLAELDQLKKIGK